MLELSRCQLGFPYFEAPGFGDPHDPEPHLALGRRTIRIGLAVGRGARAVAALLLRSPTGGLAAAVVAAARARRAVWMLTAEITSPRGFTHFADTFRAPAAAARLGRPRRARQPVTYLGQAIGPTPNGLRLTEFWNRSFDNVYTLDGSRPGPGPAGTPDLADVNGHLRYDPGGDYVLEDNGVKLIGNPIESQGSLTLLRINHPWQLSETYYLREPDGWIGSDGGYVYFGPAKRGTLLVEVSRAGFCNASVRPTPVTVRVGPPALNQQRAAVVRRATSVRHVLVHSCQAVPLAFNVRPRSPCACTSASSCGRPTTARPSRASSACSSVPRSSRSADEQREPDARQDARAGQRLDVEEQSLQRARQPSALRHQERTEVDRRQPVARRSATISSAG